MYSKTRIHCFHETASCTSSSSPHVNSCFGTSDVRKIAQFQTSQPWSHGLTAGWLKKEVEQSITILPNFGLCLKAATKKPSVLLGKLPPTQDSSHHQNVNKFSVQNSYKTFTCCWHPGWEHPNIFSTVPWNKNRLLPLGDRGTSSVHCFLLTG